jgi:hypothetical protein
MGFGVIPKLPNWYEREEVSFPESKADIYLNLVPRLKTREAILQLPIRLHGVVFS